MLKYSWLKVPIWVFSGAYLHVCSRPCSEASEIQTLDKTIKMKCIMDADVLICFVSLKPLRILTFSKLKSPYIL